MDIFHAELEGPTGREKLFTGAAESMDAFVKEMEEQFPRHELKSVENSNTGEKRSWA
jgi:uncharacterized protein with von Willebrand factor type A (vWA) domain